MSDEDKVRERGLADGAAAGSWVIDGNTSDAQCARILAGLDDGDPEILDMLPQLQLGQWADDPTFAAILADVGIDVSTYPQPEECENDFWPIYADAWSQGVHDEVERACRAHLEGEPSEREFGYGTIGDSDE